MTKTSAIKALMLSTALMLPPGLAEAASSRVALIIGNSDYTNVNKLPNPVNDAALIETSLKSVGFETVTAMNAGRKDFVAAVKKFVSELDGDSVALIYYAGHGIQYRDENFLLPVDTEVKAPGDLPFEAVSLKTITDEVASSKARIAIVILDACRDNPLKKTAASSGSDLDDGLAKTPSAVGTFVAFATAPGTAALDGRKSDRNSPFSRALADYMTKPGLPIEQVFKRVRETVVDQTKGQQVPWDNTSLITDFFFVDAMGEAPEIVRVSEADATAWRDASTANTLDGYKSYVGAYPTGLFADLAATKIRALESASSGQAQNSGNGRGIGAASDLADWNKATAAGTDAAYQAYLDAHPTGLFVKLARLRREDASKGDLGAVTAITTKPTSNFEEFAENPLYPEVTECDRLAGHVQEAADPAVGVFFKEIEPKKAIPACQAALEQYPDSLRLLINYARAIDADGRHEEARELYRAGTEAGFPIAYRSLGDVYRDGRGVEKDLKEARYWYVLGAEKHNVFAELNLANIYEAGQGVPVDKAKAVYWLWRSARQGFAPSMDKLAGYYLTGEVVPKDEKQAALLLQGAAEMGFMWSEQKLGELYLKGTGVKADPKLAVSWLERAAVQGNPWGQAQLADLYKDGVGTKKDIVQSLKWFYLARDGGADYVVPKIAELEASVSRKQVKQAQQLAQDFTPRKIK